MGIIEINNESNTLRLFANIYLYGFAANDFIAIDMRRDINSLWNAPEAKIIIDGKEYMFVSDVSCFYTPYLKPEDVFENDNPLNNYIRVEGFASGNISFVDGLGSNTGYFLIDNLLNSSTTAAHEFGHTLGLDHPTDMDLRGKGIPGIMYPRGTLVDPYFQYDPNATAGAVGGTMNPFNRKVLREDVSLLNIQDLKFNKNGRAIIGDFSSIWHEPHLQIQ